MIKSDNLGRFFSTTEKAVQKYLTLNEQCLKMCQYFLSDAYCYKTVKVVEFDNFELSNSITVEKFNNVVKFVDFL